MSSELVQANFRVPGAAQPVFAKIARLVREDPSFIARLARFVEEETDPGVGALLSQRLDRVERTVHEILEMQRGDHHAGTRTNPNQIKVLQDQMASAAQWVTGEGRGRRLTPEGEAYLMQLAEKGLSHGQIASILHINRHAVSVRLRKELRSGDQDNAEGIS